MQKYVIGVSDQNRHKQRRWLEVEGLHNLRRENKDADINKTSKIKFQMIFFIFGLGGFSLKPLR